MKKLLTFFIAGAAIAALSACDDSGIQKQSQESTEKQEQPDEQKAIGVLPTPVSDIPEEVSAFLEELLIPSLSEYFEKSDHPEEVCLTINSEEELNQIVPSSVELPGIDFENHTLVIVQCEWTGGNFVESQSIDSEPDVMILNMSIGSGNGLPSIFTAGFCTLYPKLPQKPITLNRTYLP